MNKLTDCYSLSNGVKIPCVGFGTWQTPDGDVAYESVLTAVKAGYRNIDTAAAYGNEESVGKAIRDCGVKREELFVTSKLRNTRRGYEDTLKAFEETRTKLGLEYLDLYLVHWPVPFHFRDNWEELNRESWKAMEELYEAGKIRAIGISNFLPHHIDSLMKTAKVTPHVNQIKLCPGCTQDEVVSYCKERNILLEAYSPLGNGKIFEVEEMKAFSEKYHKTVAQICLRWCLQQDFLPLPKSVTASRIQENTAIFDFTLSDEDVAKIAALTDCCGPKPDPDNIKF